jgi:lincosamide nucleotidyltransferase A/C/D/E
MAGIPWSGQGPWRILLCVATSTPPGARTTLSDVLSDVLTVLDLAGTAGARLWVDGGWGVDALLGLQSREHADLDVAVEARDLDAFVDVLSSLGFATVGEDGATAWNFLLVHPGGVVVDLHVIVFDADGNGVLGPSGAGNAYPAASLTGQGRLDDRTVDCVAAEWAVRFHDCVFGRRRRPSRCPSAVRAVRAGGPRAVPVDPATSATANYVRGAA